MSHKAFNTILTSCSARISLAKIANKWNVLIISFLINKPMRYKDLLENVEGISGKVLSETLRDLERDGMISRKVYKEFPPKVEYKLTDLGFTLTEILQHIGDWIEKNLDKIEEARESYDNKS